MPMTWKETRPGRWERPLSSLEKINLVNRNVDKALDRDQWAKTAAAKLTFDPSIGDPETALRIAWKQVRYNYPEIAAFPYQDTYMYRIGNPDQVALWVSATFSTCPNTTVDHLLGHIPRNEQMGLYWLPDSSEVLIRSPHYRLDGRGAIFCLDYLVESLSNLDPVLVFGGCAKNLSPSIDDALDIPLQATPRIEQAAEKRLATLKPRHPPLFMKDTPKSRLPGVTRRNFIKLSIKESRAVIKGCSSSSMDLTTALHAALITAVTKVCPPTEVQSFMASFHCDLRFLIRKPVSTRTAPTSCTSVLTTEVEVSPQTDFKSYYSQLAPVYATGYGPYLESTACYHEKLIQTHYSKSKTAGAAHPPDSDPQPRFGPLGMIDHQLRKDVKNAVRVTDFWFGGETLTRRKMVHSWMWDGQIVYSCCWNDNYWTEDVVVDFLEKIKETLIEEFQLVNGMSGLGL
ncbi:hypothetical protein BU24DRAFT_152193 [Aaosphaeria arxii CBS 175.79]|uniref:Uncharacterized protein n=1 Tax=Aaosphaeria arxii CBS 175.79 TaxID=1450172 RepID=A0A6A5XZ22_9PLEO|nr:uncharacterized protein BU24DRAFT_152193 [Aaosphaeria arxii CBS 175.79]KAF2017534.1 hypothetical protein BU24DRAFT_152193 [Aaosphaeria arxii CBS 175.79]